MNHTHHNSLQIHDETWFSMLHMNDAIPAMAIVSHKKLPNVMHEDAIAFSLRNAGDTRPMQGPAKATAIRRL